MFWYAWVPTIHQMLQQQLRAQYQFADQCLQQQYAWQRHMLNSMCSAGQNSTGAIPQPAGQVEHASVAGDSEKPTLDISNISATPLYPKVSRSAQRAVATVRTTTPAVAVRHNVMRFPGR